MVSYTHIYVPSYIQFLGMKFMPLWLSDNIQIAYIGGWIASATSLSGNDAAGVHTKAQRWFVHNSACR